MANLKTNDKGDYFTDGKNIGPVFGGNKKRILKKDE
jgi:hypothetical protein